MAVMSRVRVLNGRFDPIGLGEAVDVIDAMIRSGTRGYVATVNVAVLMMMRVDTRLQRFVDHAALVVADGQPIVSVSRWLSPAPLPERVAGIDLLEALLARAARERYGVYLLGAPAGVVAEAARRLSARWPGLEVCGSADGYFSEAEAGERARAVARSGAKILIVGMGVPRQEYFIESQWNELGAAVAIGVGGSLDVLSGARMRAPELLQRFHLEWLFRLLQEPRRLWRRYLVTNSQFVCRVLHELLFRRGAVDP
jgi:N-acetylglucosaminyldiphosphoundecaprenol N-acetyl-beta-D-mannosaminyltransferase